VWDFRNAETFSPGIQINLHVYICRLSWPLRTCKNIGIQTYFGLVTVESAKVFRHFAFWRHGTRLATFFIAPKNCIFEAHLLRPLKIWQIWLAPRP